MARSRFSLTAAVLCVLFAHAQEEASDVAAATPLVPLTPSPNATRLALSFGPSRFTNRELSWLSFNERVLAEADGRRHPLLERVRFLAISSANLDEFFMLRIAGLAHLIKNNVADVSADGLTPSQQLTQVSAAAESLIADQQRVWKLLQGELRATCTTRVVAASDLDAGDRAFVHAYFERELWPQLTPQSIDGSHPFPFVPNKGMGLFLTLKKKPRAPGGAAGARFAAMLDSAEPPVRGDDDEYGGASYPPEDLYEDIEGDDEDDERERERWPSAPTTTTMRVDAATAAAVRGGDSVRQRSGGGSSSSHGGSGGGDGDMLEDARGAHAAIPDVMNAILLLPPTLRRFLHLPSRRPTEPTLGPAAVSNSSNTASVARERHRPGGAGSGGSSDDSPASAGASGALPPGGGECGARFVLVEDVLATLELDAFFPDFTLLARGMFRVLRDSEVEVDEEAVDLVRMFETALKKRRKGVVIRIFVGDSMSGEQRIALTSAMKVPPSRVVIVDGLVGLGDVGQVISDSAAAAEAASAGGHSGLLFSPFKERMPDRLTRDFGNDIFAAIRSKDMVVHHPFESFNTVLLFVRAAAHDPAVIAIKQTLYRTSENSPIVHALIEAAEAGKTVTALIELKARFDEEANIRFAKDLGVHIVYGFRELKTHAKVAIVVRREEDGLRKYVHFGTGNYHPQTARVYTDLSLFTADPALGRDALRLFNFATAYSSGSLKDLEHLSVAPLTLRRTIERLVRAEIANVRAGQPAQIIVKVNALVDTDVIDLLYEASEAGVSQILIVRGMCALRPGVPGLSSRIAVKSIIGRFLEHSRIIVFANGHPIPHPANLVFISSADWMTRNLDWRVEALVPILNPTVHAQVLDEIVMNNVADTANSWALMPDGEYVRVPGDANGTHTHDAHVYFQTHNSLSGRGTGSVSGEAHVFHRARENDI